MVTDHDTRVYLQCNVSPFRLIEYPYIWVDKLIAKFIILLRNDGKRDVFQFVWLRHHGQNEIVDNMFHSIRSIRYMRIAHSKISIEFYFSTKLFDIVSSLINSRFLLEFHFYSRKQLCLAKIN